MPAFTPEIGIKEYVSNELEKIGFSYDVGKNHFVNFTILLSLRRRIPKEKPRVVIELKGIDVPQQYIKAYNEIRETILKGLPVRKFLSRSTKKKNYKDLMLSSWNITHLHLSNEVEEDGYVKRTAPVLFAIFYDNAVIFIDILNHGKGHSDVWVNEQLIQKIHSNFPEAIAQYRVKTEYAPNLTINEKMALRKNRMNYFIKVDDGTVYSLLGTMSSGDNLNDVLMINNIHLKIDYFSELIKLNQAIIDEKLNEFEMKNLNLTVGFDVNLEPYLFIAGTDIKINITPDQSS